MEVVQTFVSKSDKRLKADGMRDINASLFRLSSYIDSYSPVVTGQPYTMLCYDGNINGVGSAVNMVPVNDTPIIGYIGNEQIYLGYISHCTGIFNPAMRGNLIVQNDCSLTVAREEPTVSCTIYATNHEWQTKYCCGLVCTDLGSTSVCCCYNINGVVYCEKGSMRCWNCGVAIDHSYCDTIHMFCLKTYYLACCEYTETIDYTNADVHVRTRIYEQST